MKPQEQAAGVMLNMCYIGIMNDRVSVRELRINTSEVLRRVERGEHLTVTVDRRPVAELVPRAARATWVTRERAVAALVQADSQLRADLDALLPDTTDEL